MGNKPLNSMLQRCGALLAVIGIVGPVWAATSTGNLNVTATVANSCSISTTALDFSLVNIGSLTNEATAGEIEILCTATQSSTTVTIDGGQNESAGQRRMESAGNFMPYDIHTDAAHANNVASGGTVYSGSINAANTLSVSLYGQVPAGSYVAGSYNDVLTITLIY
ncbi:spore coat U domain-containing protein [Sulfitobacter sp. S190]|uniref:Csu type fimbrial protein n=1 Tax=Sulfitobacter sp. S190 TaxID=2867022 RepID=UPI0021A72992|nr:spore coat U domain-containing protein [Sulfitobacter sp. S190]UWR24302.1 spore coat U domain-containing protein [Sulfitobacter sp. S190]